LGGEPGEHDHVGSTGTHHLLQPEVTPPWVLRLDAVYPARGWYGQHLHSDHTAVTERRY
jgi:hypothetical protein